MSIEQLITEHLDIWTAADTEKKSGRGRSSGSVGSVYGIKKLRELILELAVRGKLVPQDASDEPASELLKRIAAEKAKLIAEGKIKKSKPLAEITDDEKPFDLPTGWEWVRLENISPMPIIDGDWIESKDQDVEGEIRLIQLADVGVGEFKDKSDRFINLDTFNRLNCTQLQTGDILIARLPNPIGRACVFPDLNQMAITVVDIAILRLLNVSYDKYVVHAINSNSFRAQVEAFGKGATRFRVATGNLKTLLLPLPPLAEQHRIVAKVDELMSLCDQLENQHNNATEAHEKLVTHLLGTLTQSQDAEDFNTNWHRISEHFDTLFTTEASIDALKQTLLQLAVMGKLTGSIPKREFVDVQELFDLIDGDRGSNYPKSHDYMENGFCLFLSTKNVRKNGFLFDEIQFLSEEKHKTLRQGLMKRGDIVITTRGTLGNVAVYDDSVIYDCVRINSGMLILRPKSFDIIAAFIMVFIQSPLFDNQLQEKRSGSAQPQIPAGILKSFTLPLFSIEEQHLIITKVDELIRLCDQLKVSITAANQLQQKLADVLANLVL